MSIACVASQRRCEEMRCSSERITRMKLRATGDLLGDPHELLDRLDEAEVVRGRGDVVHAVRVGDALRIGHVLEELLGAAVQIADDRLRVDDALAVDLQKDAQHAVRRRMLRAEVDLHFVDVKHRQAPHPLKTRPLRQPPGPARALLGRRRQASARVSRQQPASRRRRSAERARFRTCSTHL